MASEKNIKWRKTEAGGWQTVDIDASIWCPCDIDMKDTLYVNGYKSTVCPNCGRVYRLIVRVTVQEMFIEE